MIEVVDCCWLASLLVCLVVRVRRSKSESAVGECNECR